MAGVTPVLSLQLNESGQKWKICWVTSKAQKSAGTNTWKSGPWRYLNTDWEIYLEVSLPKAKLLLPYPSSKRMQRTTLPIGFCQCHIEEKDVKGKRKSCPKKMGIKDLTKISSRCWAMGKFWPARRLMDEIPAKLLKDSNTFWCLEVWHRGSRDFTRLEVGSWSMCSVDEKLKFIEGLQGRSCG